jgi:hypothetical protein
MHVAGLGSDVEVPAEYQQLVGPMPRVQIRAELLQPGKFPRVAVRAEWRPVRHVHVHDAHHPDSGGDEPRGNVRRAGKAPLDLGWRFTSQNGDAVVRWLAKDRRVIAQVSEVGRGEAIRDALDLLEAEHVRLLLGEPGGNGW